MTRPAASDCPLLSLGLSPRDTVRLAASERSSLLNFLLRWEQLEALHACLDVLIPRNPTLVSLQDLRVKAFLAQGQPDAALPVMEERLQRRTSYSARTLLARVCLAQGRSVRAEEIARALTQERPDSVMAWALLAEASLARGAPEDAKAACRRVRDLRPNGRAYLRGMLALYRAENDLVSASAYAVRLIDSAREDYALSVPDHRLLRGYFRASGEPTREAQMETALDQRYGEELLALRQRLAPAPDSPVVATGEAATTESPTMGQPLPSLDKVPVSDEEGTTIREAVRRLFGFQRLLPGQLETMACVLRGEDVLTILPTGGGKSLCYQLPAMLSDSSAPATRRRRTTLVLSPLIALMKDQVDSLPPSVRRRATTINSTLTGDQLRQRMDRVAQGAYRLVYAAPERLRQPPFLEALNRAGVERLVIDEAHCVSMWGHDFRPDYLIIGQIRHALGDPPLLAMTATAPTRVRRDILERLRSPGSQADGPRVVAGDVTRPNLRLEVFPARDNDDKLRRLLALCQAEQGSGIVYADTRVRCERLAALLRQYGVNAAHYHAGIADRHQVQDDFMSGRTRIVVATIAFGLGIDKPDIRLIIHFFPSSSLEAYYQEAGRAGRDGLPARCVLMISAADKGVLTRRLRQNVLCVEFLRKAYAAVKHRLDGESVGRVVMADLERELGADDTRIRVALSLLEEAGLVRRGPDLPRAALVRLSSACTDGTLPEDLAAFCQCARLRPRQWLRVDVAELARGVGTPLVEIEQRILGWEGAGWLTYRPSARDLVVELLPSPADAAQRVRDLLERYETIQLQRADEISAYARTKRCRHGHLNAYLGGQAIAQCGACDNCVKVPPPPSPDLPDERTQLLTVLRSVANAPWSWGRRTLLRILRGDAGTRYGRHGLHERARAQAEFGALSFRSGTAVRRLIEYLEEAGLLSPRKLDHGGVVVDLTATGRAALRDPSVLDGLLQPESGERRPAAVGSQTACAVNPEVDEALLSALRAWRLKEARKQRLSAYLIFHDGHLRAIAAQRPTTREELLAVKGVGPRRLERYGEAVLEMVRQHVEGGRPVGSRTES